MVDFFLAGSTKLYNSKRERFKVGVAGRLVDYVASPQPGPERIARILSTVLSHIPQ